MEKVKKKNIKKENKIEVIGDEKQMNRKIIITITILTSLIYLAYITLLIINNLNNHLTSDFVQTVLIFIFDLCFITLCIKNKEKRNLIFIIIGLIVINIYSIINILSLIKLNNNGYVLNFYNTSIIDVYDWKAVNTTVDIEEKYEYSDTIPEYHIISQDITPGTSVNSINKIILTISLGPNYEKEVIVPSFMGWKYDDVITYLENNYLLNVKFLFEKSGVNPNTVILQEGVGSRKRNALITLTVAIDEYSPIEIIDFNNKSLLFATSWLEKNGFQYELTYEYSDTIKNNNVISQNIKEEISNQETDIIKLIISKGKIITVPNINEMTQDELNNWLIANNLRVNYEEKYNEEIALGDIINSDIKEGDILETGRTVNITLSKGKLTMISLTDIQEFIIWANNYNIPYEINYEYSDTIQKDKIINCSHQTGDIIKIDDTIVITVSKGKSIAIPNFVGMSKSAITDKCQELKLSCSFSYGSYTESTKKDVAIQQSKKTGTTVSEGTNLVITLSSGIYEKVNVSSMIGQTKNEITANCKNLGINCNFTYESSYSTIAKDTATNQSKTGTMNKGSTITITLSKGPAATYTVVIDPNQLTYANPTATMNTLKSKLANACPGVTFTYTLQKADTGIGYLAENSEVKVGSNTFIQGKTYKVIINSN